MKVSSRRYIGCKTKLLDFIFNSVSEYGYPEGSVFADIFAGTGVVACKFAEEGYKTILNDTLYSNYVVYQAVLGSDPIRKDYLEDIIRDMNEIVSSELEDNYFSKIYGGKYFSNNDAKKLGSEIESLIPIVEKKLNEDGNDENRTKDLNFTKERLSNLSADISSVLNDLGKISSNAVRAQQLATQNYNIILSVYGE